MGRKPESIFNSPFRVVKKSNQEKYLALDYTMIKKLLGSNREDCGMAVWLELEQLKKETELIVYRNIAIIAFAAANRLFSRFMIFDVMPSISKQAILLSLAHLKVTL